MIWQKQKILFLFVILCCYFIGTEARYRDKERRRNEKNNRQHGAGQIQASTSASLNLCSRERDKKLLCYCLPDPNPNYVSPTAQHTYDGNNYNNMGMGTGGMITSGINNNYNGNYHNSYNNHNYQSYNSYSNNNNNNNNNNHNSNTKNNNENVEVTKADCWIFHKNFFQNDSIWQTFFKQTSLVDLKFTVQPTGYLDYIPTKYLEKLHNLTQIRIEYAQILIVKDYAFANLENLEIITLTNNLIDIIDQNAFSNHRSLKELNLIGNQITEIDRYAFINLPQLAVLLLKQNNLSNLHDETFSELLKLEELDVSQNLISVLTADMFKGLGNLKILKLSKNNLNFIGDTVFAELWSLHELDLENNKIERISERALDGLNNLKGLNLRNNLLKKLDNGLLRGTPALLSINLQYNQLQSLTYLNFQPIMDNLVNKTSELSVSDNKFICDCRLQWLFELRNRTKNPELKTTLDEIECYFFNDSKKYRAAIAVRTDPTLMDIIKNINFDSVSNDDSATREPHTYGQINTHYTHHNPHNFHRQRPQQHTNHHHTLRQTKKYELNKDIDYYDDQAIYHNANNNGGNDDEFHFNKNYNHNNNDEMNLEADVLSAMTAHKIHLNKHDNNNDRLSGGQLVELFNLKRESLPCPEELIDQTEIPLSRESIGFNIRGSANLIKLSPQAFMIIFLNIILSMFLFNLTT